MPDTLEDFVMLRPPTAERPLLGIIVLVVEDSRHACEGMRLICQRSGARIRRAESLASAERHLRTYRPRISVVDLGLPDGSGLDLIEKLARSEPRIDGIIATSGDDTLKDAAIAAGADTFLAKPLSSVSQFQNVAVGLLPEQARPTHINPPAVDQITPDLIALRDDLCLVIDLLKDQPSPDTLKYLSGFLASLGKDTGDMQLTEYSRQLARLGDSNGTSAEIYLIADEIVQRVQALEPV